MPYAADLYYAYSGDGEAVLPVVLLHGAGGSHLSWPAELRRLSGYQVYALDLPGHGHSNQPGMHTISDYAHSVRRWMDALGLRRAVFVGHSMGGAIALTLGLDSPQRVLGLGLLGAGGRLRVHPQILEGVASPLTFKRTVKTIVAWAFSPQVVPELRERAERLMSETRSSVLLGDFKACDAFDILSRLKELSVTTLILCGEVDRLTPPRYAEYLAEQIPGAQMRLIPQAGHMVMLERPKLVAQYLRDFLQNISFHPGEAIDLKGDEDDRG